MLSSINLGTAFAGTSFAIGDNKTLVDIFKAAVEASARRAAEEMLFRVFYDTPGADFGDLLDWFPPESAAGGGSAPAAKPKKGA